MKCDRYFYYYSREKEKLKSQEEFSGHRHSSQLREIIRMGRSLYPGGLEISYDTPEASYRNTRFSLKETNLLYNPIFYFHPFFSKIDIFLKKSEGVCEIIDISGNSNPKQENIIDLAFQKFVLELCGWRVENITVLFVNPNSIHELPIHVPTFFKIQSVIEKIDSLLGVVRNRAKYLREITELPATSEFSCRGVKECKVPGECFSLPADATIQYLRENAELVKKQILDRKYYLREIPTENSLLSEKQKIQIGCEITGTPHINSEKISEFLQKIRFPIYFLDFEAINPVIPIYPKTRAFQHIPFLFSLHTLSEDGVLSHNTYIEIEPTDPREKILEILSKQIQPGGSILCFDDTIEKKCLKESSSVYTEFSPWWELIREDFVDISTVFKNLYYYHPMQNGSTSLKSLLKPLTGLEYKTEIQDGNSANHLYLNLILETVENKNRERTRENLRDYCTMDTLALVEIYKKLKSLV